MAELPEGEAPESVLAGPPKPPEPAGVQVEVLSVEDLQARQAAVGSKFSVAKPERALEFTALQRLIERDGQRVVALPADWSVRLAALREAMPPFGAVIDRIAGCCSLAERTGQALHIPALLLVGLPGVGKTFFALSLAQALGVPQHLHSLESAETVAQLTGAEKYWSGSEAGALWRLVVEGAVANPIVVLDEIDKAKEGTGYNPLDELHAVLEPMTAVRLRDKCMDVAFNASHVIFIATANRLSKVKPSILSRLEIFHIQEPDARGRVAIARSILRSTIEGTGLSLQAAPGVVQQLAMMGSPRLVKRVVDRAIGQAVAAGRAVIGVEDLGAREWGDDRGQTRH